MQKQFITPNQQMRNQYLPVQSTRKDQTYTEYLQILKTHGLQYNPKCFPSFFKLRNGLEYPGVATKEQMNPNEVMVRVPKQLILSSFKAIQRHELEEVFKEEFYHVDWAWEDRVLNTYLLYIYGKKQTENIWFHMVLHFSKDIDIIGFWPEEDLEKFKDLTVKSAAQFDNQKFEQEWQDFLLVQKKHEILQNETFTKQNYRWIFIHLISRCFGKQLQFTSMVPFCQFFNHHSVDGHYKVQRSVGKQQEQEKQPSETDSITTEGSYMSEDMLQVGQFAYDQLQFQALDWNSHQISQLDQQQKSQISRLKCSILNALETTLRWDDFTILFVPHLILKCNSIDNEYKTGKRNHSDTLKQLRQVQQSLAFYREKLIFSQKNWRGKSFKYDCLINNQVQKTGQAQQEQKLVEFPKQQKNQYENMLLVTGKRDKYIPDHQIYFCYGPNSNRSLLLRYGFALEGNKHEHVWLSFDIAGTLIDFPDTISKMKQKNLSLRRKFQIKYNRLNIELIMFFRLNSWFYSGTDSVKELFKVKDYAKQIAYLTQIKISLEFRLEPFIGPHDLEDPNLSYHEYFINVYHQEKQKILNQQIGFMQSLIKFLTNLLQGLQKQISNQHFTAQQKFIFRHYLSQF